MSKLLGMKIAILATDGFEHSELMEPKVALEKLGAKVEIISPKKDKIKGWQHGNWTEGISVDVTLEHAEAKNYDALLLPGGVINPDQLRLVPAVIEFIKEIAKANKLIAAICHGSWTLINAELVKGRRMTSWPSIKLDLINAGAEWIDEAVVKDNHLITSRKPSDIPQFNAAIIEFLSEK